MGPCIHLHLTVGQAGAFEHFVRIGCQYVCILHQLPCRRLDKIETLNHNQKLQLHFSRDNETRTDTYCNRIGGQHHDKIRYIYFFFCLLFHPESFQCFSHRNSETVKKKQSQQQAHNESCPVCWIRLSCFHLKCTYKLWLSVCHRVLWSHVLNNFHSLPHFQN